MSLQGANDKEKLESLCKKTYKEQAVWFLNAFWADFAKDDAEKFWVFVAKAVELDTDKKADGSDLDEFQAHRFLEHFHESMTVAAMRDRLRNTGAISAGQFKRVPLTHILVFKYNVDWHALVNAVQGDQEEIRKAQKMLDEVNAAFNEAQSKKEEATAALHSAKQREEELRAAKIELEAALNELKAQEEAYNNKTEDLKRKSEEGGVVQRNKAKNELAQHLGEDPLPLRKAKITQEAAVKKTERAAQAAEAAAQEAARAKEAAEIAAEEARKRLEEAEAYLEKAKNSLPHGGVWWMERELHEAKSYLPKSKGGFNPREK
jgi:chromosome segregation ATPase